MSDRCVLLSSSPHALDFYHLTLLASNLEEKGHYPNFNIGATETYTKWLAPDHTEAQPITQWPQILQLIHTKLSLPNLTS